MGEWNPLCWPVHVKPLNGPRMFHYTTYWPKELNMMSKLLFIFFARVLVMDEVYDNSFHFKKVRMSHSTYLWLLAATFLLTAKIHGFLPQTSSIDISDKQIVSSAIFFGGSPDWEVDSPMIRLENQCLHLQNPGSPHDMFILYSQHWSLKKNQSIKIPNWSNKFKHVILCPLYSTMLFQVHCIFAISMTSLEPQVPLGCARESRQSCVARAWNTAPWAAFARRGSMEKCGQNSGRSLKNAAFEWWETNFENT